MIHQSTQYMSKVTNRFSLGKFALKIDILSQNLREVFEILLEDDESNFISIQNTTIA